MVGMTRNDAPAFNTSTRLDTCPTGNGECISLIAHGGNSRRLSAHYMVINTAEATPIRGEWPYTPAGLRAARRAFTAAVAAL